MALKIGIYTLFVMANNIYENGWNPRP